MGDPAGFEVERFTQNSVICFTLSVGKANESPEFKCHQPQSNLDAIFRLSNPQFPRFKCENSNLRLIGLPSVLGIILKQSALRLYVILTFVTLI